MLHLLSDLHVLCKQLRDIWILHARLWESGFQRPEDIRRSDSGRRYHNGMRRSFAFVGRWLQFVALLLQKSGETVQFPSFRPAAGILDGSGCILLDIYYLPRRLRALTWDELVLELHAAELFPVKSCPRVDIICQQLTVHPLKCMIDSELLIQIILVDLFSLVFFLFFPLRLFGCLFARVTRLGFRISLSLFRRGKFVELGL
jgi:hypothetical protein